MMTPAIVAAALITASLVTLGLLVPRSFSGGGRLGPLALRLLLRSLLLLLRALMLWPSLLLLWATIVRTRPPLIALITSLIRSLLESLSIV